MKILTLFASIFCLSLTAAAVTEPTLEETKAQIKQGFKEAGKAVADTTRPPRMAIKKGAKKGAKVVKKGAKAIGKGAKKVGKGVKEGVKEAAAGIKKSVD